jgi:hypothetical protein
MLAMADYLCYVGGLMTMSLETALEMSLAHFSLSPGIGSTHPSNFFLGTIDYFYACFWCFWRLKFPELKAGGICSWHCCAMRTKS